jgi:hypothetical protein
MQCPIAYLLLSLLELMANLNQSFGMVKELTIIIEHYLKERSSKRNSMKNYHPFNVAARQLCYVVKTDPKQV